MMGLVNDISHLLLQLLQVRKHYNRLDLHIEPESGSMVGGNYYAIITFKTSTIFPAQGKIQIIGMDLKQEDCSSLIELRFSATTYTVTCTYTSSIITITVMTTENIIATTDVSIKVNEVNYPKYLGANVVDVTTNYNVPYPCYINYTYTSSSLLEKGTFNTWKAERPSDFEVVPILSFEFQDADTTPTTCRVATFVWETKLKTVEIRENYLFRVDFSTKVGMSSLTGTNVDNLLPIGEIGVEGKFTRDLSDNSKMVFKIKNIALPSTNTPLITTINTFTTDNSQLVYRGSTLAVQAIPPTLHLGSVNIKPIQSETVKLLVSEKSSYIVNIPGNCADVIKAKYIIKYPSIFSAKNEDCNDLGCVVDEVANTITFITTETLTKDGNVNKEFKLTNSIHEITVINSAVFLIEVYNMDLGALAYILNTNLVQSIEFIPGDFTSFSLTVKSQSETECKGSGSQCIYTFTIIINHPIPNNGIITITLDPSVDRGTSCAVTVDDPSITGDYINGKIELNLNQGATKGTTIIVTATHLKNPVITGSYSAFTIESFTQQRYRIDSSNTNTNGARTIIVDSPGTAIIIHSIDNEMNLADTFYNFNFISQDFGIPYNNKKHCLTVKLPTQVSFLGNYKLLDRLTFVSFSSNQFVFELFPSNNPGSLSEKEVSFSIQCINPWITSETSPFKFTLCTKDISCSGCLITDPTLLEAEQKIRTSIGASLMVEMIQVTNNYPRNKGTVTLKLTRQKSSSIQIMVIKNKYLDCSDDTCIINPAATCLCEEDITPFKKLTITFSDVKNNLIITCIINVVYPDSSTEIGGEFSIITYNNITPHDDYIVDQIDKSTEKITVKCNFPCYDCDINDPDKCKSCPTTSFNGDYYYYYPDHTRCELLSTDTTCEEMYANGHGYIKDSVRHQCKDCIAECTACKTTTDYCTQCVSNYANKGSCLDICPDGTYPEARACHPCTSPCILCDSDTKCRKCGLNTLLDGNECVESCLGMNKFPLNGECKTCSSNCGSCSGEEDFCTSCSAGYLMNNKCITKGECEKNKDYVGVGNECLRCNGLCTECVTAPSYCTKCAGNYYPIGGACLACDISCNKCEGSAKNCVSCSSGYYADANECVEKCPTHKTPLLGKCEECDDSCTECAGKIDHCISCQGTYLHLGKCITDCPIGTIANTGPIKVCDSCKFGCDKCVLESSELVCVKCNSEYKYLDGRCYYVCPTDYISSSDGLSCIKKSEDNTEKEPDSSTSYLPFPHLIVAGLLCIGVAAGQARDGRALMSSNLLILLSFVMLVLYIVQTILSLSDSKLIITIVTSIAIAIQVLLNLLFIIPYKKSISKDPGLETWSKSNSCIKNVIILLSCVFSFQTYRVLYSRFLGFAVFFVPFKRFNIILSPLNVFSLLQILFVNCPVVFEDIFGLIKYSWGTNLYITMIESLILSLLIIILLAYEMKNTKAVQEELEQSIRNYQKLTEQNSIEFNKELEKEQFRKEIVSSVFTQIGMKNFEQFARENRKESPRRRQSFSSKTTYTKEKDPRGTYSSPCSPRTAKQKQVPLEKYGIRDDVIQDELEDNVYFDSVEPSWPTQKETVSVEVQTPPFRKIEACRQHMKAQGALKRRRLFDSGRPGPLEVINESPEEEAEKKELNKPDTTATLIPREDTMSLDNSTLSKMKLTFPAALKCSVVSLAEEEKQLPSFRAINSPPQNSNEAIDIVLSRPLNPVDTNFKDALPYPEIGLNITIDDIKALGTESILAAGDSRPQGVKNVKIINSDELMGSFEKDPADGCIIIRENSKGYLLDLKGRTVNELGYLIDKVGNIINKQGKYIMSKSEFDRISQDDNNRPVVQTNSLFKENTPIKSHPIEQSNNKEIKDNVSKARDSVSLDSLMEDTPSNYNLLNQRYNSKATKEKGVEEQKKPQTEEYKVEEKAKDIYNTGLEQSKSKRYRLRNLSVNKRAVEKVFNRMTKKSGFVSGDEAKVPTSNIRKRRINKVRESNKNDAINNYDKRNIERLENLKKGSKEAANIQNKDYDEDNKIRQTPGIVLGRHNENDLMASGVQSNTSLGSTSMARIKGLESIYLRSARNTHKHKKRIQSGNQNAKDSNDLESEHDEIASLISENYRSMKNRYKDVEIILSEQQFDKK